MCDTAPDPFLTQRRNFVRQILGTKFYVVYRCTELKSISTSFLYIRSLLLYIKSLVKVVRRRKGNFIEKKVKATLLHLKCGVSLHVCLADSNSFRVKGK